jgi:hypothetical protein
MNRGRKERERNATQRERTDGGRTRCAAAAAQLGTAHRQVLLLPNEATMDDGASQRIVAARTIGLVKFGVKFCIVNVVSHYSNFVFI